EAAALALDAGDLPGAHAWLDAHDRWLTWSGTVQGQSEGHALWAQYRRQAGDPVQARIHAEQALAHATEPRQPLALIAARRLLGGLDPDTGHTATAAAHLAEALALADTCNAPYERALTLLAQAELAATQGDSVAATDTLDAVRTICIPLDARLALGQAAR